MDEMMQVALLPTTQSFLEFLFLHAGEDAPLTQFGYYPGARGEVMTKEMADAVPASARWIGHRVFDGCGLAECFAGIPLEGTHAERLKVNYDAWCAGHVGECIRETVQMPGAAIFKMGPNGAFERIAWLCEKVGSGPLDWTIYEMDETRGLVITRMDERWTHWGLESIVLRYNVDGAMTKSRPKIEPGEPYAYVLSSVLNMRDGADHHLITSVPNGTLVKLTGNTREDWTEAVTGDGTVGWLFTKFLIKHNVG